MTTARRLPRDTERTTDQGTKNTMTTIKLNVPPDHTPEEEEALVARVAAAYEASTGRSDVKVELNRPEEVDYQAVSDRTHQSARWVS